MENSKSAVAGLSKILGPGKVKSDRVSLLSYSRDIYPLGYLELREGKISHLPWAICFPENIEEVRAIILWAQENQVPLVPYGAGSGVLAGAVPFEGGVVVDLKRMNRIRSINSTNLTCEAEAGIFGEVLERNLNQKGFTLGHFPASMYCSTLGGWLSTRSAGQLSAKYGKIEDLVIALEGVLADGSIFHTSATPRSATGPDLDQVLVGSEGTLAIITSALITIHHLPQVRFYRGFQFPELKPALEAMRLLMQKDLSPALLRLYDELDTKFNAVKLGVPASGCLLIAGFEGLDREVMELKSRLGWEIISRLGGKDLGEEPGKRWLEHRYSVSYQQSRILTQPNTLLDTIEVSISWARALELYNLVMEKIKNLGLIMAHFSHSWREGVCIYFSLLLTGDNSEQLKNQYQKVWELVMESVLSLGGSISHHHGIGYHRGRWLKKELGEGHRILEQIKKNLDSNFILNPGKLGFFPFKDGG